MRLSSQIPPKRMKITRMSSGNHRSLTSVRILHGYRYISAREVAQKIRDIPTVCIEEPFINCVVEYNEVTLMCKMFGKAIGDESIADPELFLRRLEEAEASNDDSKGVS